MLDDLCENNGYEVLKRTVYKTEVQKALEGNYQKAGVQ